MIPDPGQNFKFDLDTYFVVDKKMSIERLGLGVWKSKMFAKQQLRDNITVGSSRPDALDALSGALPAQLVLSGAVPALSGEELPPSGVEPPSSGGSNDGVAASPDKERDGGVVASPKKERDGGVAASPKKEEKGRPLRQI